MLFLALAILSSSSIALIFRHTETRDMNRYVVTTANYVTASLLSLLLYILRPQVVEDSGVSRSITEIFEAFLVPLSPPYGVEWAIFMGIFAGPFFILSFIFYQKSIRNNPVGLTGAIAKLGILLPMSLSLVLWREHPTTLQWLGMALAVASLLIAYLPKAKEGAAGNRLLLILLFLFGGLAEFSNKVFQKYGALDDRSLFLAVNFATAFLIGAVIVARKRIRPSQRDIAIGLAVGIPNLFSSYFLIMALNTIPAAVAFAAFGAGTIVIINIGSIVLYRERLATHEWIAVIATIIALILMNLPS